MTRTLNLTGFKTGDNLNLSVSQGALTAGPVNVASWGGGPSAGNIKINVHRTIYRVAPDSVRFTVDLDSSDFDTAGPSAGEIYDARLHDLIYLWNFGDAASGDWTAPVNVLPEWKNRNVAKGPFVAHMYTSPGTYKASVLVLEPSSGKQAKAEMEIVVADPDVVYGGSGTYPDTICINPVGDNDFSGKPVGAQEINIDTVDDTNKWWIDQKRDKRPKRILLKRGTSCNFTLDLGDMNAGLYFGDYGQGNKPIINGIPGTSASSDIIMYSNGYYARNANDIWEGDPGPDLRLSNLEFRGNLDPSVVPPTGDGSPLSRGCWIIRNVDWMISNCDFSGLQFVANQAVNLGDKNLLPAHFHFDNCTMTAFGGTYPIFMGQHFSDVGSVALTGCKFAQTPDAIDNDILDDNDSMVSNTNYGSRAIMRVQWAKFGHVRGCDFYHTDSTQPALKMVAYPDRDGPICNVHSTSFEGGSYAVWFAGTNPLNRNMVGNMVLDGNIHVGAYSTYTHLYTNHSGITLRNTLFIGPRTRPILGNSSFVHIVYHGGSLPEFVTGAPIRIYNNTVVGLRTTALQGGYNLRMVEDTSKGVAAVVIEENNILHQPNLDTPVATYAPLDDTQVMWIPRCPGYRDAGTKELDTSYATPLDTVKSYRPLTGSPALGAALKGDVSYMDMTLKVRPEPPSIGAWEME